MLPKKRNVNMSLRTFKPGSGQIVGGFDIKNISPEKARMVKSAYAKAAANIAPGLGVRAVETETKSSSGKVQVNAPSSKKVFGMPNISQEKWDSIFKKKRKK